MDKNSWPKVKKRFVIGMSPALITLILVVIAVCIIYSALVY